MGSRLYTALAIDFGNEGLSGWSMMPKSGYRFPACAKPLALSVVWLDASAGEARSENIMLQQ
jgi:hypothetical protein